MAVGLGQAETLRGVNNVDEMSVAKVEFFGYGPILEEGSGRVETGYSARFDCVPRQVGLVEDATHVRAEAEAYAVHVCLVEFARVEVDGHEFGGTVHVLDRLPVVGDQAATTRQLLPVHDHDAEFAAFGALKHFVLQ